MTISHISPQFGAQVQLSPELSKRLDNLDNSADSATFRQLAASIRDHKQAIAELPDSLTLVVADASTVTFRFAPTVGKDLMQGLKGENAPQSGVRIEEANIDRALRIVQQGRRWRQPFSKKQQTPWGRVNLGQFITERFFNDSIGGTPETVIEKAVEQAGGNWKNALENWQKSLAISQWVDQSIYRHHDAAMVEAISNALLSDEVQKLLADNPAVKLRYHTTEPQKGPEKVNSSGDKAFYKKEHLLQRDFIEMEVALPDGSAKKLKVERNINRSDRGYYDRKTAWYDRYKTIGYYYKQSYAETPQEFILRAVRHAVDLTRMPEEDFRLLQSMKSKK